MNQELYNKLQLAVEFCDTEIKIASEWNKVQNTIDSLTSSFNARKEEEKRDISFSQMSSFGMLYLGTAVAFGGGIGILAGIGTASFAGIFIGAVFFVPGALLLRAGIRKFRTAKRRKSQLDDKYEAEWRDDVLPQIEEQKKQAEDWEKRYKLLYENCISSVDFLPEKYRNRQATHFMLSAVSDGRAETLKEAFNLFEEQLHRWRMEDAALQAADVQAMAADEMRAQMAEANAHLSSIENMKWIEYIHGKK